MNERVLVTAIGSFSAKAVIEGLKRAGCRVIGCDIHDRYLLGCGDYVENFYKVPLFSDTENYIATLVEICRIEEIDGIFPLTDAEIDVLNDYRSVFEEESVKLCISDYKTICLSRNKYETYYYLSNKGIDGLIKTDRLCDIDIYNTEYPIVGKPDNGRSSQGLQIFGSADEIEAFLRSGSHDEYVFQPYLSGNIVTVDVCRDEDNDKTICLCREELIRTSNGAGLSVRVFNDSHLETLSAKIAETLNVKGTVCFEFIKTDEGYRFVECNPRFSGGVAFSCLAGYDFVSNSFKCFLGKSIDDKPQICDQYIVKEYVEKVTKKD